MLPEELSALGDLAGEAAGGLTRRIRDTHRAIAHRVFDAVGPPAKPVQVVHDGIASLVYGAVGTVSRHGLRAAATAARPSLPPGSAPLQSGEGGRRALALLNGAAGDLLHERHSPLELRMALLAGGEAVALQERALRAAYPDATGRLAVFVHGLGQSEAAWTQGGEAPLYGEQLRARLGITPLYVRYNSGRAVADNGRQLAALLGRVTDRWPVAVSELTLVGHALGALVCRSALAVAAQEPWVESVDQVISLGAPHRGTSWEKLLRTAGSALSLLPETRPASRALEMRSAGLRDSGEIDRAPFLPHVRYRFVSASLARDADRGLGRMLGDLVVSRESAWAHAGAGQPVAFPVDSYRHIGGASHFALTHHPAVLEQIVAWLGGPAQLPPPQRLLPPAGGTGVQP